MKAIAFYLPQFHPIPENDEWWGAGFTEWTNVKKARPQFRDHYQPHVPTDLGYYDLRNPDIRSVQAALAGENGIHGFCYYHYWFNGRRILERPFQEVLASGQPDFPFCLCWANENWTRIWDGGSDKVLLEQQYSDADDEVHIRSLLHTLSDPRYIRVNDKPLFLVYRTELLPDPRRTAERWREIAIQSGIGDLYLARVESFSGDIDPRSIGFDASVEFAPDWRNLGRPRYQSTLFRWLANIGLFPRVYTENSVFNYAEMASNMLHKAPVAYRRFRCAMPNFDNSPRRAHHAAIACGSSPELYEQWLRAIIEETASVVPADEQIVFINAWNEWGEGNHLEPDVKFGRGYLEATLRAISGR